MAKSSDDAPKTVQRGAYICSGCKTEFEGTACPECGNVKGNMRLAADGIEHDLHKTGHLFAGANTLRPTEDFLTDAQQLERKRAKMQMEELDDNLREAYVLKSQLKLHDQQMALRRKEIERKKLEEQSEEYVSGRSSIPPPQPGQGQGQGQDGGMGMPNMNMPFMQQLSPQAIFMQQLMRMDGKKRAEFIEQLSEADPGALANLSAMFPQTAPQQPQQQYPGYPHNPYGQMMMSPWMQQPAPQPQQHQTDPIALVTAIFELSQKMQPPRDEHTIELVKELKDENKKTQEKIDSYIMKERDRDRGTDLQRASFAPVPPKSLVEQVSELTTVVESLEKVGLVTRPGRADKSVDDELKIKEFEFKREMKTKEMDNESAKVAAEQNKAVLTQSIVSSLLQRGIQKGLQDREGDNPQSSGASASPTQRVNRVRTVSTPVKPPEPVEVIDEVQSDAGIVRETRRPVKRVDTGAGRE
jgi:hypothetical protein